VLALIAGPLLIWAFWPTLDDLANRWWVDPRYSYGWLVPAFAGYLLHRRRDLLEGQALKPSWAGPLLIGLGVGLGLAGQRYHYQWVAAVGLLPALIGLALSLGGAAMLRWAWPSVAYLIFMIPLPWRLEIGLGDPLLRMATTMSTYVLQTLGQPSYATGNIIHVGDAKIGVVDACNGLGMMMMFFAFAAAVALLSRRSWVHKTLVVLSAPAIAIVVNVVRISATGLLHRYVSSEVANRFYHDLAGLLMMPLALGALGALSWLLARLIVEETVSLVESRRSMMQELMQEPIGVAQASGAKLRGTLREFQR
jgi:exosortase